MTKIDTIKEQIGWLKIIFGAFLAADFSLLAWIVQNIDVAVWYKSAVAGLVVVIFSYFARKTHLTVKHKIQKMDKL